MASKKRRRRRRSRVTLEAVAAVCETILGAIADPDYLAKRAAQIVLDSRLKRGNTSSASGLDSPAGFSESLFAFSAHAIEQIHRPPRQDVRLGHQRTWQVVGGMFALPPKADMSPRTL
jgi:hypothetical protein